ncbi:MAG: hypothetical protein UY62_C0012G0025 [Parcubacteria group bacterium GW2011_GWF2_50_9]|nr:MAG: hypothetical protein UY62_C0012G0025 [Parcubacteria group bacterium GW2011_GWF2_50_9]
MLQELLTLLAFFSPPPGDWECDARADGRGRAGGAAGNEPDNIADDGRPGGQTNPAGIPPYDSEFYRRRPVVMNDGGFFSRVGHSHEADDHVTFSEETPIVLTSDGEQGEAKDMSRCGCGRWDKTAQMKRCEAQGCRNLLCRHCQLEVVHPHKIAIHCPSCHDDAAKKVNTWVPPPQHQDPPAE